jgi:hypothetical protein
MKLYLIRCGFVFLVSIGSLIDGVIGIATLGMVMTSFWAEFGVFYKRVVGGL